jgi:dual oxidase
VLQVLLQVPQVSRFQWHPFTISTCIGNRLQIHIKADGNWTDRLHKLASSAKKDGETDLTTLKVGLDGPFGAPAQRFYTFDKSIIV